VEAGGFVVVEDLVGEVHGVAPVTPIYPINRVP
jgi:hypothetical protein